MSQTDHDGNPTDPAESTAADTGVSRTARLTPDRWARIEALFAQALDLAAGDRTGFLEACEDAELRAEVASLLEAHAQEAGFIDTPAPWFDAESDADPDTPLPEAIGPYQILRSLGRGGMGQVYLAERRAPGFSRQVALKVMRRGLDTDDLIERFARERQILARLDHPNIARLYDVGATAEGRPFYVMEYVDGRPILEHCNARRLDVDGRVRLFRTVCDAVQHAHAKLVVHRDLKPGNILVAADGSPRLLDFGIARLLDDDQSGNRLTHRAAAPLTPGYAAPEQIRGEPVTTATEVYSLGLLLYEMLCGRHPYAGQDQSARDTAQAALTVEPPRPSRRLADGDPGSVARDRAATPSQLARQLEGDLDNIVLKAIRKEPGERYPSVQSLADDLDRYMEGLPVLARPATAGYRIRKFIRRNRLAVGAASTVFAVLLAATMITLRQSGRIRQESQRVARERDKALEVRSFLLEMFGSTGPDQTADSVTAREMLDRRRQTLAAAYADDPETRAEMMMVLAEGYERLGLIADAEPLARDGLDIRRRLFGDRHPDVVVSLNVLGWLLRQRGDPDGAETLLRQAVETGRIVFPTGDARLARALNDLGVIRMDHGDAAEAMTLLQGSLDMRRRVLGDQHIGVAITTSNLAAVLYNRGDLESAVRMAETALLRFRELLGSDHQRTLLVGQNLAVMRSAWGDPAGAARWHRQILESNTQRLGPDHPTVAWGRTMLANDLKRLGQLDEARTLLLQARATFDTTYPGGHHDAVVVRRILGDVDFARNDLDQAMEHYSAGLAMARQILAGMDEETAVLIGRIARVKDGIGDRSGAAQDFRTATLTATRALGPSHSSSIELRLEWLEFLIRSDNTAEALSRLAEVDSALASDSSTAATVRDRLTAARTALRRTPPPQPPPP